MDDVFSQIERWCSPHTDKVLARVLADPELERACRERYAFVLAIDGVELERLANLGDCVRHLSAEELLAELERVDREVVPVDEVYDEWASTLRFSPRRLSLRGQGRTEVPGVLKLLDFIQKLDLSGNELVAYEPDPRRAGRLRELDLSSNRIEEFPMGLCKLVGLDVIASVERGLEQIDLSDNLLTTLPAAIRGQRKHLRVLRLDRNRFTEFPEAVLKLRALVNGELVGLEALSLADNVISEVPGELEKLTCLKALHLQGNQLKHLPDSLARLSLEHLDLSGNQLTVFPACLTLGPMASLQTLRLADNPLGSTGGELPEAVSRLKGLELLDLRGTGTRAVPASLGRLKRLHTLDLRDNPVESLPAGLERDGLEVRL